MSSETEPREGAETIRVKVLFFAKARDLAGTARVDLELPLHQKNNNNEHDKEATPKEGKYLGSDLLNLICDKYELAVIKDAVVLAINEEYCDLDGEVTVRSGDEIAVIPPLSGG